MGKWIFGGLFIGVALIFIVIGAALVVGQHRAIRNAEPTTAVIESAEVVTTSSGSGRNRSRSTRAAIRYRYRHEGTWLQGDEVHPAGMGMQKASELVKRFRPSSEVPAFYDRRDPNRAFLLKEYSFGPYLFMLFPMLHLSVGLAVAMGMESSLRRPPRPERGPASGSARARFALEPQTSIRRKLAMSGAMAAVWYGVGGAALGHFFSAAAPPYGTLAVVVSAIYGAVGLIPLGITAYYWRLSQRVSDASVSLDRHPLHRGEPASVRVRVPVAGGSSVEAATVTLKCVRTEMTRRGSKRTISRSTMWEAEQPFARPQDITGDRTLAGDVSFTPPADQPPSSPAGTRSYPRYNWHLTVHLKQPGPDYKSTFVIDVE